MHALSAKAGIRKFDFKYTDLMRESSDKMRNSLANLVENFAFIDGPMRTEVWISLIPEGNLCTESIRVINS